MNNVTPISGMIFTRLIASFAKQEGYGPVTTLQLIRIARLDASESLWSQARKHVRGPEQSAMVLS